MGEFRIAALAGMAVLAGALTMLAGLIAAPGPWLDGYVSEAGTAGMPLTGAYRLGLVFLAFGVAVLGRALHPASRPVAVLLGLAAVLAGTSGAVPCTGGCPLPPFEPTTLSDVAHTAASILGMVALAGAMAAVALSAVFGTVLRRLAGVATALIVPLGGALGLTMLFAGRGELGALLERGALVVAVAWLIGTAIVLAIGRGPDHDRGTAPARDPATSGRG
ncbi:MAG: DUF998 domain-containing protein [Actinoplanes sp.]